MKLEIYTIGHSTYSKERFIEMLHHYGIELLADVRAFPGSKKFPHFSRDHMPNWLKENGFDYYHMSKLGGRRNKSQSLVPEVNGGWNNQSFHNYADYTLTDEFKQGISGLMNMGRSKRVAYCCSERHPSRCHRLIISNWLKANGWKVKHIMDQSGKTIIVEHELGEWGAMPIIEGDGTVVYPDYS